MLSPSPDPAPGASAAAGAGKAHPVVPAAIVETIRKTRMRFAAPAEKAMRKLVERLQEHVALLMQQDLGPDDDRLNALRERAEECSAASLPDLVDKGARAAAWKRVQDFADVTEELLARWCQVDTSEGDYELRTEEDEHGGYYVWDTASRSRASLRSLRGSYPAAHMPLEAAWQLTRRLNEKVG